jgi:hypothetical protein
MKLQYTFTRKSVTPLCTPLHGRVYILLGCKVFMGINRVENKEPLIQEDNQAPQPTFRHFKNREDEGGKSFDLMTHEIPIRGILTRPSSDRGESGPLDREEEKRIISGVWLSGEMGSANAQTSEAQNCKISKLRNSESG